MKIKYYTLLTIIFLSTENSIFEVLPSCTFEPLISRWNGSFWIFM